MTQLEDRIILARQNYMKSNPAGDIPTSIYLGYMDAIELPGNTTLKMATYMGMEIFLVDRTRHLSVG